MERTRQAAFRFCWLGAAGFILDLGTAVLLVDPFLSRPERARPALNLRPEDLEADAIFVTHGHFDHAVDVPAIARRTRAPVYAATPVCAALHDMGTPASSLHPLAGGRVVRVGAVAAQAIPARHVRFDLPLLWRTLRRVGGKAFGLLRQAGAYPQGEVLAYQFTVQDRTVVHLGSAGWYPQELEELYPDVALVPLQGHSRIYRVALDLVHLLRPRRVVPHHHDDFCPPISELIDIEPFAGLLRQELPTVEVVEPRIGQWLPLFGD